MFARIECIMWARRVGYDYLSWIGRKADEFGLVGVTFFCKDGSIKVVAEGAEEALNKFVNRLNRRHIFTRMENFSATWHKPKGEYQDFSVLEKEYNK